MRFRLLSLVCVYLSAATVIGLSCAKDVFGDGISYGWPKCAVVRRFDNVSWEIHWSNVMYDIGMALLISIGVGVFVEAILRARRSAR